MSDSGCIHASSGSATPGPPGLDGDDGLDGTPGPPGRDGAPGPPGTPGVAVVGRDGEDGLDGEPGPPGRDGAAGRDGTQGAPGVAVVGRDGEDGLDGEPGPPGRDGARGRDGAQGPPGNDGDDGNDGPPGAPGTPAPLDGWIPLPYTLNFSSNTTGAGNGAIVVTITGTDATAILYNGVRLRFVSGGNTVYGVVETATFSTNTTVTLVRQSDYTITAGAITVPYYSLAAAPTGWLDFFNYLPMLTGYSAAPTGTAYVWQHWGGNTIQVSLAETTNGTSNATNMKYTLPATASTKTNAQWQFSGATADSGTVLILASLCRVLQGTNVMDVFADYGGGTFTNTGGKRLRSTSLIYQFG